MWNGKHKQKLPWGTDSQSDLLDLRVQEWYHQSPEGQNKIKTKQTKKEKKNTHTPYLTNVAFITSDISLWGSENQNCLHKHFWKLIWNLYP